MTKEQMRSMVRGASQPWSSVYAVQYADSRMQKRSALYTDQRIIDLCLNCKQKECSNCLDSWKKLKRIR